MWMITFGSASLVGGLLILFFGTMSGYGAFEGIERYRFAGVLISLGIVLLIWGYRRGHKIKELFTTDDVFLMCPKCGEPYNSLDVKNNMCPTCRIDLEPIEGFYSRHPEFKD